MEVTSAAAEIRQPFRDARGTGAIVFDPARLRQAAPEMLDPGHWQGSVRPVQEGGRGAAWFVKPKVAYRYTGYDLQGNYDLYGYQGRLDPSQASPFTSNSPSRSLPIVSVDSGLVFDRNISLFGTSYTQTLEPRL